MAEPWRMQTGRERTTTEELLHASISDAEYYAQKANCVAIHRGLGNRVALIEVVSPGDKHTRRAFQTFARRATSLIRSGIDLLIVDLFPSPVHASQRIH